MTMPLPKKVIPEMALSSHGQMLKMTELLANLALVILVKKNNCLIKITS